MARRSQAVRDVIAERLRQIREEGWTAEHDDAHANGQLERAAAAYALFASCDDTARELRATFVMDLVWAIWPVAWARAWWKPKTRRRDLVRAAALIIAAIERGDRKAARMNANKGV